jgi:hypothetical protein
MKRKKIPHTITRLIVAALPLFCVIKDINSAFYLILAVMITVLICDLCLALMRQFGGRLFRVFVLLFLVSTIFQIFILIGQTTLAGGINEVTDALAMAMTSAFLLAYPAAMTRGSFKRRIRGRIYFCGLLLLIGIVQQIFNGRMFASLAFFTAAAALSVYVYLAKKGAA